MKQTLLGEPIASYEKKLKREVGYCYFALVALLVVNIGACFLRTDENHAFLLMFNILSDILVGGALIYRADTQLRLKKSLLRLARRTPRSFSATVHQILETTHRIPGVSCVLVRADERMLYLPQTDTIKLFQGQTYTFGVVDNVIVEVES